MSLNRVSVEVTSDGSGNATAYTPVLFGRLHKIAVVPNATTTYSNSVNISITTETTAQNVWVQTGVDLSSTSATIDRAPTSNTHLTTGAAVATQLGVQLFPVANERLKIVLAGAGASKTGTWHFIHDGPGYHGS